MGDADELGRDEELPPSRRPLVTSEGLAVTSLTAAVTSLLVTEVSQYLIFLLGSAFGLGDDADSRKGVTLVIAPVALLSFVSVVCGVVALKRRPDDRWVAALAFAGVTVGAVVFLLAAAGLLAPLVTEPLTDFD